ncbi:hypothetical protein SAMN04488134_11259 [Amphibacillus marinus]|uniref:Uncharacterized protein n=1 Tax=Amphibacillus marinus TaxID=872970 RepID=A0A1H8SA85_9BACI|nr:hypothetical protein [Amphibacillus marinus]SEO75542.1 hypothetical protein SAMN04488134_11259 [Amphibacillus marinus]
MRKRIVITLFLISLVLTGCNSNNGSDLNEIEGKDQLNTNQGNEELTLQTISLEEKLVPPKFIITNFNMNYSKEKSQLFFDMNYEIDTEIYEILTTGNQEMHFILEYHENVVETLRETHSDAIIAEKPSDYNTKYQVTFTQLIDLARSDVELIEEHISGFNLLIADSEKDIISQFVGLYDYN